MPPLEVTIYDVLNSNQPITSVPLTNQNHEDALRFVGCGDQSHRIAENSVVSLVRTIPVAGVESQSQPRTFLISYRKEENVVKVLFEFARHNWHN